MAYPKVKVRKVEEYDDQYDFETKSLQSLKAFETLSLDDFSSPDDSPTSVVRVPWLHSSVSVSASASPSASAEKGVRRGSKQNVLEEKSTNIRASPVLRPRAVLSSPDNDGKAGNKSKKKEELHSGLKNHNHSQNRHIQRKVIPRPIAPDVSMQPKNELKDVADTRRDHQAARQRRVTFEPSLGTSHTNRKH